MGTTEPPQRGRRSTISSAGRRRRRLRIGALAIAAVMPVAYVTVAPSAQADGSTIYVDPDGDDSHPGTLAEPVHTLARASRLVGPGDTIAMMDGTYLYESRQDLETNGLAHRPIVVRPHGAANPVIDLTNFTAELNKISAAIRIRGSYWHLSDIEIRNVPKVAGDGRNGCLQVNGSNNVIMRLHIHHCGGAGLEIGKGSGLPPAAYNWIVDTDSHDNVDILQDTGNSNADGFANSGSGVGNVFVGNRSWRNADDGFDLLQSRESGEPVSTAAVTLRGNWAMYNGLDEAGRRHAEKAGDGKGFKLGSNFGDHVVARNVSWRNRSGGFYENMGELGQYPEAGGLRLEHNTSALEEDQLIETVRTFGFAFAVPGQTLVNNLSTGTPNTPAGAGTAAVDKNGAPSRNSWSIHGGWGPHTVTADDFISVDDAGTMGPRQPDGSLPVLPFLRLRAGSPLVDAGVDLGAPSSGRAPDLGAFESTISTPTRVAGDPTSSSRIVLSWLAVPGATSYDVENIGRSTLAGWRSDYADFTGLERSTTYRFRVRARTAGDVSAWSDIIEVTTRAK